MNPDPATRGVPTAGPAGDDSRVPFGGGESGGRLDPPPPRLSRTERVVLGVLALAGLVAFGVARHLSPDPRGLGTHQQIGMPPCGFHLLTGLPCPGCGLTTSFCWTSRGELLRALRVHPFGTVLALAVFAAPAVAALFWLRGKSLAGLVEDAGRWRGPLAGVLLFGVLSWGYKVLMALLGIPTG